MKVIQERVKSNKRLIDVRDSEAYEACTEEAKKFINHLILSSIPDMTHEAIEVN